MPIVQFSAILFDFDDTLSQSALDYAQMRKAGLAALAAYGFLPEKHSNLLIMEAIEAVCSTLAPEQAMQARKATMDALKEVEVKAAQASKPFPFTRPMLSYLNRQGIAVGIVTRNCPEAVVTVLPDVHTLCQCVVTREDLATELVKPHPEHVFTALRLLECSPEKTLMVGDHPMDVLVGKRAGTKTAGVYSGENSRESLKAEKPDWLAADCKELMEQLGVLF